MVGVILIDGCADSIVRGTTSKEIIQMAKDVGAKRVIVASCAPPIRFPNVYGIDMPSRAELVAHGRTDAEVAAAIGAAQKASALVPDEGPVLDTLAHLLALKGDLPAALAAQRKAAAHAGDQAEQINAFLKELEERARAKK